MASVFSVTYGMRSSAETCWDKWGGGEGRSRREEEL